MTKANFSGHFGEWLRFKLRQRDWDLDDLTHHRQIGKAKILDIIHGVQEADTEFYQAIAHALEMSEKHILCMVDALSQLPSSEENFAFTEVYNLMKSLSPEVRVEIMKFVRSRSRYKE